MLAATSEIKIHYSEGFCSIWQGNMIISLHIHEVAKATVSFIVCQCRHTCKFCHEIYYPSNSADIS